MADGDITLSFSFSLAAAGGQVKVGDATTGTISAGPTTGTVS